jgi:hypothetical protein
VSLVMHTGLVPAQSVAFMHGSPVLPPTMAPQVPAMQVRPWLQLGIVVQQGWALPPQLATATQVPPWQLLPSVQVLPAQHMMPLVPHIGAVLQMPFWQVVPAALHAGLVVQQAALSVPHDVMLLPPQPAMAAAATRRRAPALRILVPLCF